MNELVKKLMEAGKALRAAAKELGASDAEIDACIKALGGFPLDDSVLEQVGGGRSVSLGSRSLAGFGSL